MLIYKKNLSPDLEELKIIEAKLRKLFGWHYFTPHEVKVTVFYLYGQFKSTDYIFCCKTVFTGLKRNGVK